MEAGRKLMPCFADLVVARPLLSLSDHPCQQRYDIIHDVKALFALNRRHIWGEWDLEMIFDFL